MTDLEITKACAEAMRIDVELRSRDFSGNNYWAHGNGDDYDPLHDDAQAMALVKKFGLHTGFQSFDNLWGCLAQDGITKTYNTDLNRAICECVAKMMKGRT